MKTGVEIRKVDKQGRLILPPDWRKSELKGNEVFMIAGKGCLKIIPRIGFDPKRYFDKADLGVPAIGDWKEFERRFATARGEA